MDELSHRPQVNNFCLEDGVQNVKQQPVLEQVTLEEVA